MAVKAESLISGRPESSVKRLASRSAGQRAINLAGVVQIMTGVVEAAAVVVLTGPGGRGRTVVVFRPSLMLRPAEIPTVEYRYSTLWQPESSQTYSLSKLLTKIGMRRAKKERTDFEIVSG